MPGTRHISRRFRSSHWICIWARRSLKIWDILDFVRNRHKEPGDKAASSTLRGFEALQRAGGCRNTKLQNASEVSFYFDSGLTLHRPTRYLKGSSSRFFVPIPVKKRNLWHSTVFENSSVLYRTIIIRHSAHMGEYFFKNLSQMKHDLFNEKKKKKYIFVLFSPLINQFHGIAKIV